MYSQLRDEGSDLAETLALQVRVLVPETHELVGQTWKWRRKLEKGLDWTGLGCRTGSALRNGTFDEGERIILQREIYSVEYYKGVSSSRRDEDVLPFPTFPIFQGSEKGGCENGFPVPPPAMQAAPLPSSGPTHPPLVGPFSIFPSSCSIHRPLFFFFFFNTSISLFRAKVGATPQASPPALYLSHACRNTRARRPTCLDIRENWGGWVRSPQQASV